MDASVTEEVDSFLKARGLEELIPKPLHVGRKTEYKLHIPEDVSIDWTTVLLNTMQAYRPGFVLEKVEPDPDSNSYIMTWRFDDRERSPLSPFSFIH